MEVTELPIVTFVKALWLNALLPMVVTELGISMLVRPQASNAPFPMAVTVLGMTVHLQPTINVLVDVSMMALHPSRESNFGLPLSTMMLDRPRLLKKASSTMVVIVLGKVTLSVLKQ